MSYYTALALILVALTTPGVRKISDLRGIRLFSS